MTDKDKTVATQPKNIPKDGQVIMSIMREMGITDYDLKTIVQLTEFVYRYATSILEEARVYANNSKKKILDVDDVRLAIQLSNESTFTSPPPREVIMECASYKNYSPLPQVKPHCGLRLPPDRYCLSSCNYVLKNTTRKKFNFAPTAGPKVQPKSNVTYIKRGGPIPKPVTKITLPVKRKREDDQEII